MANLSRLRRVQCGTSATSKEAQFAPLAKLMHICTLETIKDENQSLEVVRHTLVLFFACALTFVLLIIPFIRENSPSTIVIQHSTSIATETTTTLAIHQKSI
jgi:hypothetical protein